VTLGHLERIIADRRVDEAVRMYARQLRARLRLRMGDPDASRAETEQLGFVTDWRIVGPFDNEGKTGFDRVYPPERDRMAPPALDEAFGGRERPVRWRIYPDVTHHGLVSFDAALRPRANVCAYAETLLDSPRAQPLSLWIGGGGATRVWWNGEPVHEDGAYRAPHPDRAVAVVGAHAGLNRVPVKTCVAEGAWGFYLRVADARGRPASGLRAALDAPADRTSELVKRYPKAGRATTGARS
jgi:cellulose synthase operon protein C